MVGIGRRSNHELAGFLKWKRGRKIVDKRIITDGEGNTAYQITVEGDNNSITIISSEVYELASDRRVRSAQSRILSPLNEDGVNEFQVRKGHKSVVSVSKEEFVRGYFDVVAEEVGEDETTTDPQTFEAYLNLRAPVFSEGKKWQFMYGDQRISATILDAQFLNDVFVNGKRFGAGDVFYVRLRLFQVLLANGKIRNNFEVVRVIETKDGAKQIELELKNDGARTED